MPERAQVVHFYQFGVTACLVSDLPNTWPKHHVFTTTWDEVNCPACLQGKDFPQTYQVLEDGRAFKCLRCGRTSYNPHDVEHHYCGCCHAHHDDLIPYCKAAWLKDWGHEQERNVAMREAREAITKALKHGATKGQVKQHITLIVDDFVPDLDRHVEEFSSQK